jgi:hypothetical protein
MVMRLDVVADGEAETDRVATLEPVRITVGDRLMLPVPVTDSTTEALLSLVAEGDDELVEKMLGDVKGVSEDVALSVVTTDDDADADLEPPSVDPDGVDDDENVAADGDADEELDADGVALEQCEEDALIDAEPESRGDELAVDDAHIDAVKVGVSEFIAEADESPLETVADTEGLADDETVSVPQSEIETVTVALFD